MARWQPARADVIADYAREVLAVHPRGRIVVGVDGIEWPGSSAQSSDREVFAADLAATIAAAGTPASAVRMPVADVGNDVAAFRSAVLEPFRRGSEERAVLVVSGAFLHAGELAGVWHTSAWIRLSRAEAAKRDAARDVAESALTAWYAEVDRTFRLLDARKLANATFDLTDPEHPRREFEDAC